MNNYCLYSCTPSQIINISIAIDDISLLEFKDNNGNVYNSECLKYSYSTDGVNWTCWYDYDDVLKCIVNLNSDFFIKVKINGPINTVSYNGVQIDDWNTSFEKCFDFSALMSSNNPNQYNPYSNNEYALGLYQQLSETISSMFGIPIYYFRLSPNANSKDITFKEYSLMNVSDVKQIKLIVNGGEMPSSRPEFSDFGFDFSTDWETEISKYAFFTAFGQNAKPMEGDLIYIPMMKRMWMVNTAYEEKKDGFMWNATTFKVSLVKYEDKSSVDLGDMQDFVDSLIKSKFDDVMNDNLSVSNENFLTSPKYMGNSLYPIFESDSIRKYVKHTALIDDIITDLNAKLISNPTYHKGIMVSENMYDWRNVIDESYIIYSPEFKGDDATVSFIINIGNTGCDGTLLKVGSVYLYIVSDGKTATLSLHNLNKITVDCGKTYFIVARWSKSLNCSEMISVEYSYPSDVPSYKLNKYMMNYDFDNMKNNLSPYDIELEQCEKENIILYSFDGCITDIKIYDSYINDLTELIQMYPNNKHIVLNDTVRKFINNLGISVK